MRFRQIVLSQEAFQFTSSTRPRIDPHADHGHKGLMLAHRFFFQEFLQKTARRQNVEQGRLHRHDNAVHDLEHPFEVLAHLRSIHER